MGKIKPDKQKFTLYKYNVIIPIKKQNCKQKTAKIAV